VLRNYAAKQEDELFRNPFSGGSGTPQDLIFQRSGPLRTGFVEVTLALLIGVILQFGLKKGPFTLLLGCLGALPTFFYSTWPIRPADKGYGETLIAFFCGWLPIAAAFYIQRGYIAH
jgi:1,4-dihydroxy-2-naphthoate octaprenyltransferase